MRLLCLSNGHGEDWVAVRVLHALQALLPNLEISVLPLVGSGEAYQDFSIIGPVQTMPSGGFLYMDGRQLAKDVQGGLVQLTWKQLKTVRTWAEGGGLVLAVGDIVPLAFAWWSQCPYAFIGTARSEYYLRNEQGPLKRLHWWQTFEAWSGCVYQPWERWLMRRSGCCAIFPRDTLTSERLKKFGVNALDVGNPMMDKMPSPPLLQLGYPNPLQVLLLPGSRAPEAYDNWDVILRSLPSVARQTTAGQVQFLAALAPRLNLDGFYQPLIQQGWEAIPSSRSQSWLLPGTAARLELSRTGFQQYLLRADCAIAMAGTATEQFVGLGKPAIAIPGKGPQYTFRFAEAQSRLLGPSLTLVEGASEVGAAIQAIFADPARQQIISENGPRRMGKPGAAMRIAQHLVVLLTQVGTDEDITVPDLSRT